MKTNILLISLALWFISCAAFAQTDSVQFRKNEIGLDLLPLLDKTHGTSLLYRRHQQKAAWRVRVFGAYRQSFEDKQTEEFTRNAAVSGRVGHEWHCDLHKMRFYYGLDFGTEYYSTVHSIQKPEWSETHSRNLEMGILPVLGFGYNINSRFTVSTEANGRIFGGRQWIYGGNWPGQRFSYIGFNALSDFALFMSYRF
jgi:hypothetical protein